MAYSVTSSFIHQMRQKKPAVTRTFTITTSDFSNRVLKWPKFKRVWNDIRPKNITVRLANGDQGMNFLRNDKTLMEGECIISMGVIGETIALFTGTISDLKYTKEDCILSIADKFQQLSQRQMGTSDVPLDFTTSDYLPSDLTWYAITSHGGYSALTSTNNPDIDFEAFEAWAAIFSGDSVLMQGIFDGQKVTEVLRKISRGTESAIFIKEDKISFHRFGIIDTNVSSLGPGDIIDMSLAFSKKDIVNKQYVSGDYDTTSDFHKFTVFDESSNSVNSFGLNENTLKDNNLWYVNSSSAINLAQRRIITTADPDDSITIKTGLVGLPRLIGETVAIEDDFFAIQESYRILGHDIDSDKGQIDFVIDRTQISNPFILDTSTLNNTVEVLT